MVGTISWRGTATRLARKAGAPLREHVSRVRRFLGITVRLTLGFLLAPCRAIRSRRLPLKTPPRELESSSRTPGRTTIETPEALVEAMASSNPGVRSFALGTIGENTGEEITILVLDALNDPDPSVRRAAAAATARARISSAVFSLILLLGDPAPRVAEQAGAAIEKITGRAVDIGPGSAASTRRKRMKKLKMWWKKERFARLTAEVNAAMES